MNRLTSFVAATSILLLAALAGAQTNTNSITVRLAQQRIGPDQAIRLCSYDGRVAFGKKSADWVLPARTSSPEFIRLLLGSDRTGPTALLGWSRAAMRQADCLWIDWTDSGRFDTCKLIPGRSLGKYQVFGPISPEGARNGTDPFFFIIGGPLGPALAPAIVYSGHLRMANNPVLIGLVHELGRSRARLLVDYNSDGRLCSTNDPVLGDIREEPTDIEGIVQMPDGSFYRARPAGDCGSITFEKDTRPVGTVLFAGASVCLWLQASGSYFKAFLTKERPVLPQGEYQIFSASVFETDAKGRRWRADAGMDRANRTLRVTEGKTAVLRLGGTFNPSLNRGETYSEAVKAVYDTSGAHDIPPADARGVRFGLGLKDHFGNTISDIRSPRGAMPPPPRLRIVDGRGKLLADERFHYG